MPTTTTPSTRGLMPPGSPATPPPAPGPRRWKWTRRQYTELSERGYFDGERVELVFGEIIDMGKQGWPHVVGCRKVAAALAPFFSAAAWFSEQRPFAAGEYEPVPDLAVVPGKFEDFADHPAVALLVVEVADTTLAYDTTTKAELYATAGVPEYWVIDLTNRQLVVFRDPAPLPSGLGATAYRTHLTFGPADTVSPLNAPTAAIRVGELLP